jgi:cytochrome c
VLGRKAGAGAFPYSNGMKKAGFNWTEKHLFAYLKAPSKYVPGTKMAFAGLPSEKDRADLIAYLKG